jgi:23S rRNA (cytosine1962-C5)-methyltransferase
MLLETSDNFKDFELLDSGLGYRLERWGDAAPRTLHHEGVQGVAGAPATGTGVILQRPDPQIIWQPSLPNEEWEKAWAIFETRGKIAEFNPASAQGYGGHSAEGRGNWEIKKPLPNPWIIKFGDVKFLLKLSPFKHTGIFAEQAANWDFMIERFKDLKIERLKILNLFAYTGGATMVLAKAGCQVTHVDASKPAITWANENHKLNNLPSDSVRWILDDAVKFVKREIKRGVKYDGIIMDPPAFGHSPTGKTWKFNDDLPGLLSDCVELLSDNAKFLIVNGYATNSSALALNNLLEDAIKSHNGKIEFGELCLKQKSGRMLSTGIFARWSC